MRRIGLLVVVAGLLISCGSGDEAESRTNQATEWYLRSVAADGRTINFVYTMSGVASGCQRKGKASVEEAKSSVVVIAYKSVTTDRNRACTEELAYVEESVVLDRPLATRALVGCRPGRTDLSEDAVCRDVERSRTHGIFEFSPPPSG